jgi:hypothetical protein
MPPTTIATIAIAGMITFIAMLWMSYKAKLASEQAKSGLNGDVARLEQILAETQTEMARLRERVQVLERLATDEDRRVASEISRLGQPGDGMKG